jgi:hypothetical protein
MKRALLCAVLIVAGLLLVASPAAASNSAHPLPAGYFVVCGRGTTTGPNNCMSLQQAIDAATPISGTVTIEMLPGEYCPPTLPTLGGPTGVYWSDLKFVGVGLAAYGADGPPISISGPEAELTSFKWDSSCGGTVPDALFDTHDTGPNTTLDFRNLAFVGTSGGPTYGLHDVSVRFGLRDVMFDGLNTGLYWQNGASGGSSITDSAFVHNTNIGAYFNGGTGSFVNTTFSDNQYGFYGSNFLVNLLGDTLTHNTTAGFFSFNGGNSVQAVNTINAGNTGANCSGNVVGADWETAFSENNLVGSDCPHSSSGDLLADGSAISDAALNGGPTPSVEPPTQAQGHADANVCGSSTGGDQREFSWTFPSSCDIGAVQTTASGVPTVTGSPDSGSTIDFGTIPLGISRGETASAFRGGGDLLYVFAPGAKVIGAGFAITTDTCQYDVMPANTGSCLVGITATPTDDHSTFTGTLKIKTSGGTLTYPLTAKGEPALEPPSGVHAAPGNKQVTLSWSPPSAGPAADHYQIRMSDDGGATWNTENDADASPSVVKHLTNGTGYEFEVASVDSEFDVSDWSAPSNLATPHTGPDASALTAPADDTVDYGVTATVKGTLTDTDTGQPIATAAVNLLSRKSSSGTFSKVGSGTTSTGGKVSVSVQPNVNAEYEWKYAGDSTHHAATGSAGTIDVAQVVTAQLKNPSVKMGSPATVWGTVAPDETGQSVQLQKKVGGSWVTKATATIAKQKLPDGTTAKGFVLTITPTSKGAVALRVRRPSTASNATGLSAKLTLQVT